MIPIITDIEVGKKGTESINGHQFLYKWLNIKQRIVKASVCLTQILFCGNIIMFVCRFVHNLSLPLQAALSPKGGAKNVNISQI